MLPYFPIFILSIKNQKIAIQNIDSQRITSLKVSKNYTLVIAAAYNTEFDHYNAHNVHSQK